MWFSFQILRVFQRSFCALASYDLLGVSRGTLGLGLLFTVLEGRPCWLPCSFCWYLGVFPAWLMRIDRIPGTEWAPVTGSYSLFRWFLPGLRWFLPDGRCSFLCWMPSGSSSDLQGPFSVFQCLLSTVLTCDLCPRWFPNSQLHHLLSGSLVDSASIPSLRVGAWKFCPGSELGHSLG